MLETAGKELYQALFNVQQELDGITKDSKNPFFKSSYADRTVVLNTLKPLYAKEGLLLIQAPVAPSSLAFGDEKSNEYESGEHGGSESKTQPVAALALATYIVHVQTGQYIESRAVVPLPQADPQGYGSALTYTSRYSLVITHALPLLDDDGNAASKVSQGTGKRGRPAKVQSVVEVEKKPDPIAPTVVDTKTNTVESSPSIPTNGRRLWGSV